MGQPRAGGTTTALVATLLADARLPSGGHAQSAGLEPAVRAGLPAAQVPQLVQGRLRTVVRVEAGTAVAARSAALRPEVAAATDGLLRCWGEWAARTPSPALRAASADVGRGYRRLLGRLWGGGVPETALTAAETAEGVRAGVRRHAPRAVVLGVVAAAAGLDAAQTAALVGYDDVQTVLAACLKLEPMDPVTATGWALDAFDEVAALADELAGLTDPHDIPAAGAPQVDRWAQAHDRTTERLFRA